MLTILLVNSLVVFILASALTGVEIKSFWTAIGVAIVLGIINVLVKPLIILLTLPLTIITLGLFIWVINAWMIMLVDKLIEGFKVKNFGWALIFALFLSILNSVMFKIF